VVIWLFTASLRAFAQQVTVVPTDGSPLPGEHVSVLVAIADAAGAPIELAEGPTVGAERGTVLRAEGPVAPGLWAYGYKAPLDGSKDELSVLYGANVERKSVALGRLEPAQLVVPPQVEAKAGEGEVVAFRVTGADLPPPDHLQVRASEGELVSVAAEAGALLVTWRPDAERFPRSIPIAVRDGRRPRVAPAWTTAQLHSVAVISDRTEPGTEVRVRVAGRSYGPVRADDTGRASISVEVRPGEHEGVIERTDPLGNVGRSSIPLGGKKTPALAMLVESALLAGQRAPLVHLAATKPGGDTWDGAAPACRTSLGDAASVVPTSPGRYLVLLPQPPADTFFDLRVDCAIGTAAQDSLRLPVARAQPARLVVRPYPPEVSADFPVAQVQAFLENSLGDRLPANGIVLRAERGELALDPAEPAVVRGEYRGYRAAPAGRDELRGTWNTPPGDGPLWALELGAAASGTGVELHARAIDALGHPLADRELTLAVEGRTATARTNERGWAVATIPAPESKAPWTISSASGALVRQALVFPGTRLGRDPARADLEAVVEIPIVVGRIREVAIWSDPKTLTAGGETARIHVRLTDRTGNPVTDETIELAASAGVVTDPKARPDGTYEATFAPPSGFSQGTIRITVTGSSSAIKTSTEIEVAPREVSFAPGVHVGYLLSPPNLYAPFVGLQFDNRLGRQSSFPFFLRGTLGVMLASTDVQDASAEHLTAQFGQLGVSLLYRRDSVRRAAWWVGGGPAIVGYRATATYVNDEHVSGLGVTFPGISFDLGYGWRVGGGGEIELDANYVFLPSVQDIGVGWRSLSGVVTTVGYKVLY
jgi:hypothetical protein